MDWLALEWFYPSTLYKFDWEHPNNLYFILLIPFLFAIRRLINVYFRQKVQVALSKQPVEWQMGSLLRYIPKVFQALCLVFILISLARPKKNEEQIEQISEGIDILLALDISESMLGEDFKPNRLAVAKKVAIDFIKTRKTDRIGLVIFAGEAYSLSPLTTDYTMLQEYVQVIEPNMISVLGTAIGSALGVATNRLRESESKTKVIILVSDGDSKGGNLDPITAAHLAAYYGIKIYTILIGNEGDVPFGKDSLGNPRIFKNTIDEKKLREIAQIGEGNFFRAYNNNSLNQIFRQIDRYEKSVFSEIKYKSTKDFYHIYLTWAIIFFLIWLFFKATYLTNVLED